MSTLFSILGVRMIVGVFMALVPIALLIVLQVWLCRKGRRLGLILPCLSLAMSLLMVLSVASFQGVGGASGGTILEENGVVIQETVTKNGTVTVYDGEGNILDQYPDPNYNPAEAKADTVRMIVITAVIFLAANIPTVIFGGIWLHYKGRRDTQEDLRRMRIEDLD